MKVYLTSGKVTAQAETLAEIETLLALKHPPKSETVKPRKKGTKRRWSLADLQTLRKMRTEGKTTKQIARALGRTPHAVRIFLYKLRTAEKEEVQSVPISVVR